MAPDPHSRRPGAGSSIRPDLLLTDYNLPNGIDGLELLARVRSTMPNGLPAIVLTGDISRHAMARIAGNDCLQLSKPINHHELAAAIAKLCPPGSLPSLPVPPADAEVSNPVIYVVDDDPAVLDTLREVLEVDDRVVAAFASAEAFLLAYPGTADGCLLVDAHLPGMNDVDLLAAWRERGDTLPTILITGAGDVALAVAAMRTGACDFIEKPVGRPELLDSVTRAIAHSRDNRLLDHAHEAATLLVAGLTRRQREVMEMVLAGHPSKNIAADLGISQRTVENHRAAIMRGMNVRSIPELARMALLGTGD